MKKKLKEANKLFSNYKIKKYNIKVDFTSPNLSDIEKKLDKQNSLTLDLIKKSLNQKARSGIVIYYINKLINDNRIKIGEIFDNDSKFDMNFKWHNSQK